MKLPHPAFYFRAALLSTLFLSLFGCFENNRNTNKLCENHPNICAKLNIKDGQCRHERTDLIWKRYKAQEKPSDLNLFDELLLTKKYAKCMEMVAQIETTTLKSKKQLRTEALFHSFDAIEALEKKLKSSYQPSIIYYRWTQGEREALEQFLKLEETDFLNSSELQLGLASYYADKDKEHTIQLLLKSLTFYDGRKGRTLEKTIPEVIKTLATLNHGLGKRDQAYLWALIGENLGLPVAKEAQLNRLYPMTNQKRKKIAYIAKKITNAIEDGEFNKKMVPRFKNIENTKSKK